MVNTEGKGLIIKNSMITLEQLDQIQMELCEQQCLNTTFMYASNGEIKTPYTVVAEYFRGRHFIVKDDFKKSTLH